MMNRNSYQAFDRASRALVTRWARGLNRQVPFVWNAALVDRVAVTLVRNFFMTTDRPHLASIPETWKSQAEIYATPELEANPESFFPKIALPEAPMFRRCLNRLSDGGERSDIRFKSSYRTYHQPYQATYDTFKENETVHVRLWQHSGAPRPTVLCVHGWLGGYLWVEEQIFAAKQLYKSGLNVALIVLPFHGARRPAGRFEGDLFPSSDLRRTNEGFGQAVTDVRTVLAWIRDQGFAERVGLMGFSLGAYVGAMVASLESNLDFVVNVASPASVGDLVWEVAVGEGKEATAKATGFDRETLRRCLAVHCPLSHQLKVPKDNILLVGGRGDFVVPPTQIKALWQHWGEPHLAWFPGGHYVHFGRQAYLRQACTLMAGGLGTGRAERRAGRWLQHLAWG